MSTVTNKALADDVRMLADALADMLQARRGEDVA